MESTWKDVQPFDFVRTRSGSFGIVREININRSQPEDEHKYGFHIEWIFESEREKQELYNAWWSPSDFSNENVVAINKNILHMIAGFAAHPFTEGSMAARRMGFNKQ